MHLFRVRLILALIASVTLVSLASTYFDVLAHRHDLREDLDRRTKWMAMSIEPDVRNALEMGDSPVCPVCAASQERNGRPGTGDLRRTWQPARRQRSTRRHDGIGAGGRGEIAPARRRGWRIRARRAMAVARTGVSDPQRKSVGGAMAIVVDASYIRSEDISLWQRSFWRIVAFVDCDRGHHGAYGALVPSSAYEPRG